MDKSSSCKHLYNVLYIFFESVKYSFFVSKLFKCDSLLLKSKMFAFSLKNILWKNTLVFISYLRFRS